MIDKETAKKTADAKACQTLLDEYTVSVSDAGENWRISYVPRGRVRGGGFEALVSKQTGAITDFRHMQ
jgi:hypothetical protein